MQRRNVLISLLSYVTVAASIGPARSEKDHPNYLAFVTAYADAMLNYGQDSYGEEYTPLFAEALDRETQRALRGKSLRKVAAIPYKHWGIRPHDRMLGGANPHHCQNLYQILYALTPVTGKAHYADRADRSLKYFLEHCQGDATGLFYWGEHAGWDLSKDKPLDKYRGDIHEFYRPWILWQECWRLATEPCQRFATGLWQHQIGDHRTGDFSRHARISTHAPGDSAPYARHGGFYIETWGVAYHYTQDDLYLQAIESVLNGLEQARLWQGGYLISRQKHNGRRRPYDISLAVSLHNAAAWLPQDFAQKMLTVAAANDEALARVQQTQTGQQTEQPQSRTLWSNAYGSGASRAHRTNPYMLRYRQTQNEIYREVLLEEAKNYQQQDIDLSTPIWPGTVGDVIWLMLNAYELTGEDQFLVAAERFAQQGVALFLNDGPLPKASHVHGHYEGVTRGDTLMMALLRLSLVQHHSPTQVDLIYTDR